MTLKTNRKLKQLSGAVQYTYHYIVLIDYGESAVEVPAAPGGIVTSVVGGHNATSSAVPLFSS